MTYLIVLLHLLSWVGSPARFHAAGLNLPIPFRQAGTGRSAPGNPAGAGEFSRGWGTGRTRFQQLERTPSGEPGSTASSFSPMYVLAGLEFGAVMDVLVMPARDEWDADQRLQEISNAVSFAGQGMVLGGLSVSLFLAGSAFHRPGLEDTGYDLVKGVILTTAVVSPLKWVTGRWRPFRLEEGELPFRFEPLRKDGWSSSFPSGHAALSWMFATVIDRHSGGKRWVRALAYGGAVLISLSRITNNRHHPADVIAGAMIGYFIGRLVSR